MKIWDSVYIYMSSYSLDSRMKQLMLNVDWHQLESFHIKAPCLFIVYYRLVLSIISAARKFEQKRAKFLKSPKDLHQSNFKTSKDLHQRPRKVKNIYIKALKFLLKTGLNRFFDSFWKVENSPKKLPNFKSPQNKSLIAKLFKNSPKWW